MEDGKTREVAAADTPDLLSVLDALADPVILVKPDYEVVLINRRARELFGTRSPAGGRTFCYQVSHRGEEPCSGSGHPCPMKAVLEGGEAVKVIHEHYDEKHQSRFVEITASPLRGRDGAFAGIVESQRDVTERVLAERTVKKYAAELERSNALKDLFNDILRHDLMNPLSFILTAAGSASKEAKDPRLRQDLQDISKMSRRIRDMIQNASTLVKVESGQGISLGRHDIAAMAEMALQEHVAAAGERSMTLRLTAQGPCWAQVNPLFHDVLSNLIGNAVKYGKEGTEVEISIDPSDGGWRVAVADRGEGIPDEDKEKIFTRFTRRAKEGVKGTGLGLAIVSRVVELHGGKVWVEDNPGRGSRFVVLLTG